MRTALLAAGLCLSMIGSCFAQGSAATVRMQTRIAPQALGPALKEFAESRHLQVLYFTAEVNKLRTSGASGDLTADQVLDRLLDGTGLKYRFVDTGAVSIFPACCRQAVSPNPSHQDRSADRKHAAAPTRVHAGKTAGDPDDAGIGPRRKMQQRKTRENYLKPVLVTGSRIPELPMERSHAVRIYDRVQIQNSGQDTVTGFLNTLPDVSLSTTNSFTNGEQTDGGQTAVQLHGMPVGTTLVLINGEPTGPNGLSTGTFSGGFFDLNTIPVAAVKRIEVLANGSSAIYGSDAIAGVVNIVLRKRYNGVAVSARYSWADGLNKTRESLIMGKRWRKASLMLVASYQKSGALTSNERALTANQDFRRFGGPDNRQFNCAPGNVYFFNGYSFNGGAPVPYAAVPAGYTGPPSVNEFSGTAGQLNECNWGATFPLVSPAKRAGVLLTGRYSLTPSIHVFSDLIVSHVKEINYEGPYFLYGQPGYQQFTVPANNPYNPFGETVGVSGQIAQLGAQSFNRTTTLIRPVLGVNGTFLRSWHWKATAVSTIDKETFDDHTTNAAVIQNDLNSTNPTTALNPFIDGPMASPQELKSISNVLFMDFSGENDVISGYVRGPLLDLPAGKVQIALGGDYRYDKITNDYGNNPYVSASDRLEYQRSSYAVFGQARVPILSRYSHGQRLDTLLITLAGRFDHYSDFGSTTNPQFGFVLRPLRRLAIRGTYATSFLAPPLSALFFGTSVFPNSSVSDPSRGGQTDLTTEYFGSNPNLRPETGQSRSLGVVYVSRALPGLNATVTYWTMDEKNYIQELQAQTVVDNAGFFPGDVIRAASCSSGPPCPITIVKAGYVNFGRIDAAGIDYDLHYTKPTQFGEFSPYVSATETTHFTSVLLPGTPVVNVDSNANIDGIWAPRWKGTAGIDWSRGPVRASFDGRFVGPYVDYAPSTREIGDFWLFDTNVRYAIGQALGSRSRWLRKSYVEFGGTDIFNRLPQYSDYLFSLGFDPAEGDIVGRYLYVSAGVGW